jgi:hypothetical protein
MNLGFNTNESGNAKILRFLTRYIKKQTGLDRKELLLTAPTNIYYVKYIYCHRH